MLTQQDLQQVKDYLLQYGKKDTQLNTTDHVNEEDKLVIVQNNENKCTTIGDALLFNDKQYSPMLYSGMGRKYLRKNIKTIGGETTNYLEQSMLTDTNTVYIVQYDYTINSVNKSIEFPSKNISSVKTPEKESLDASTSNYNTASLAYNTALYNYNNAKDDYDDTVLAYNAAVAAYDADPTDENYEIMITAEASMNDAKTVMDDAEIIKDNAENEKNNALVVKNDCQSRYEAINQQDYYYWAAVTIETAHALHLLENATVLDDTKSHAVSTQGNIIANVDVDRIVYIGYYTGTYSFRYSDCIIVPGNSVLKFEGGSINDGVLVGTDTNISADVVKIFGSDIIVLGAWNIAEAYPEWFGAVADSNNDCSAAFVNCINLEPNVILLKEGVYSVNNIWYNKSIRMIGHSNSSTLKFSKTDISKQFFKYNVDYCSNSILSTDYTEEEITYGSTNQNSLIDSVILENITFDGNDDAITIVPEGITHSLNCFTVNSCKYVSLKNCKFKNTVFSATSFNACNLVEIEGCYFDNIGSNNINVNYITAYNAVTCKKRLTIYGTSYIPVECNLVVRNSQFRNIRDCVLNTGMTNNLTIENNYIKDVGGYCFEGGANDTEPKGGVRREPNIQTNKSFKYNIIENLTSNVYNYGDPDQFEVVDFIGNIVKNPGATYARVGGYNQRKLFYSTGGERIMNIMYNRFIGGEETLDFFIYLAVQELNFVGNVVDGIKVKGHPGGYFNAWNPSVLEVWNIKDNIFNIRNAYLGDNIAIVLMRRISTVIVSGNIFNAYSDMYAIGVRPEATTNHTIVVENNKLYHKAESQITTALINVRLSSSTYNIKDVIIRNNITDGHLLSLTGSATDIGKLELVGNNCLGNIVGPKGSANTIFKITTKLINENNICTTNAIEIPAFGSTSDRPNSYKLKHINTGFEYYDTDLGKPIYVASIDKDNCLVWWKDSDGNLQMPYSKTVDGFVTGKYIATNQDVGAVVPMTETNNSGFDYIMFQVSAGDVVKVKGVAGAAPRLWAILSRENTGTEEEPVYEYIMIKRESYLAANPDVPYEKTVYMTGDYFVIINVANANASPYQYSNKAEEPYEVIRYSNSPIE